MRRAKGLGSKSVPQCHLMSGCRWFRARLVTTEHCPLLPSFAMAAPPNDLPAIAACARICRELFNMLATGEAGGFSLQLLHGGLHEEASGADQPTPQRSA